MGKRLAGFTGFCAFTTKEEILQAIPFSDLNQDVLIIALVNAIGGAGLNVKRET